MVMLVGVQSNQFPRSLDIAKQFRRRGVQVAIGGFHVSGTLSMLPECDPAVQEMMDLGVSVFAGEAEGQLEGVLQDAVVGKFQTSVQFSRRPTAPRRSAVTDHSARANSACRRSHF